MSSTLALFLVAIGEVSALTTRQSDCSFTIDTGGDVSYPVGQYSSGQTRAGSDLTLATFTISNTSLTDSQGRGCWWTPPATVLQCDVGQVPETGFQIGCDGSVTFNGQSTFYECQSGDDDQVDIYLNPNEGSNCGEITLTANSCFPTDCSAESTTFTSTETGSTAATEIATVSSQLASVATPEASSALSTMSTDTYTDTQLSLSTIYSTVWQTIIDCGVTVTDCPVDCTSTTAGDSTVDIVTSTPVQSISIESTYTSTPSGYPISSPVVPTATATLESSSAGQLTETETYFTNSVATSTPNSATTQSSVAGTSSVGTAQPQSTSFPSPDSVDIPASCPGNVTNAGEFTLPDLIIPVDSSAPSTASGTSYFGEASSVLSTIFNFDIASGAAGKTCNLVFLFPEKDTLETSSFTFSGSGSLDFSQLTGGADADTTYDNMPAVASDLGTFVVAPGNAYNIASFACSSANTLGFKISVPSGGDTSLEFFQDYNPCPLGLFITTS